MPGISYDRKLEKAFLFFGHELLEELDPSVLNHDSILESEDKLRAEFPIIPGRKSEGFLDAHSTGLPDMEKSCFMVVENWHIKQLLVRKISHFANFHLLRRW